MPTDLVTASFASVHSSLDFVLFDPRLGLVAVAAVDGGEEDARAGARVALEAVRIHLDLHADQLQRFRRNPAPELRTEILTLVEEAFVRAAGDTYAFSRRRTPALAVTLDVVLLLEHEAFVGHVGDGRVYLVRRGLVHLLTVDHSLRDDDVEFTDERAQPPLGAGSRRLTRALGPDPTVRVETLCMELMPDDRCVVLTGDLHRGLPEVVLHGALLTEAVPDLGPALGAKVAAPFAIATAQVGGGAAGGTVGASGRLGALAPIPLFRHCSERELRAIAGVTTPRVYEADQVLFAEGEPGDALFLLISGDVHIERNGQRILTLSRSAHFGEMALLDEPKRSAAAIAATRCEVLTISREKFFGLLRQNPHLAVKVLWNLVLQLSSHLRNTSGLLAEARRQSGLS